MDSFISGGNVVISLEDRIDSSNADMTEYKIINILNNYPGKIPVFDAAELDYISSGGLRALMRVRKAVGEQLIVRDVSPYVYELFEMTGFNGIFNVQIRPN